MEQHLNINLVGADIRLATAGATTQEERVHAIKDLFAAKQEQFSESFAAEHWWNRPKRGRHQQTDDQTQGQDQGNESDGQGRGDAGDGDSQDGDSHGQGHGAHHGGGHHGGHHEGGQEVHEVYATNERMPHSPGLHEEHEAAHDHTHTVPGAEHAEVHTAALGTHTEQHADDHEHVGPPTPESHPHLFVDLCSNKASAAQSSTMKV